MVGEEQMWRAQHQTLLNPDISRPRRPAVVRKSNVFYEPIGEGVRSWAGVINHVYGFERLVLLLNTGEKSVEALDIPLGLDIAGDDQNTHVAPGLPTQWSSLRPNTSHVEAHHGPPLVKNGTTNFVLCKAAYCLSGEPLPLLRELGNSGNSGNSGDTSLD